MENRSVLEFFNNSVILVTGGSGFLGKVFIEKVLRVQPNIKKLYLLLRASDTKSAMLRFYNEILAKDLFNLLKENYNNFDSMISEKVTIVAGDVSLENFGVRDSNILKEMLKEVEAVINIAANTNFDDRYDVTFCVNTMGAKHVLEFSKKCTKLRVLVHVSTAYVCGEKEGLILEKPIKMGGTLNVSSGLDFDSEKKLIDETLVQLQVENCSEQQIKSSMTNLGIQRAKAYGWPNTYVFTKAMGEMVIEELKGNLPVVIVRPTMVTSTFKEPFSGWIEGARTIDGFIVKYAKGRVKCFPGDPKTVMDLIPVDMVVNTMIIAMVKHAKDEHEAIFQIGSSVSNPCRLKTMTDCTQRYFMNNPWVDKHGHQIIVKKFKLMNSMKRFNMRYKLPLKGFKVFNNICFGRFNESYNVKRRMVDSGLRMAELYKPYVFFKGCFDDKNTKKLRRAMKESNEVDECSFYFDPKVIDWEEYFMEIHIPGLVKHVMC